MSATQIHIPKSIVVGALASIGVLIVASSVLTLIAAKVPFSPIAKILEYLYLNHNNPVVYGTQYYRYLEPRAEILDAYIVTPLAMLISGTTLGVFARKNRIQPRTALAYGAVSGAVISVLIIAAGIWASQEVLALNGAHPEPFSAANITTSSVTEALLEIGLATAAYAAGAWLVARRMPALPAAPPDAAPGKTGGRKPKRAAT